MNMRPSTASVHAQTSTSDMTSSANLHLHHPSLLRGVLCSMSDGVNDVEVAKATVMSEASAEGSTVAAGQATQTDSRSEAGGEAAQPLASNGLDQQTQPQTQAMMPPPKRMPPPMFKSPTPPIAKPAADSADATGVALASPVCQLVADVRVGHTFATRANRSSPCSCSPSTGEDSCGGGGSSSSKVVPASATGTSRRRGCCQGALHFHAPCLRPMDMCTLQRPTQPDA